MAAVRNPKVTALVDTFNHKRFIHQAILSIINQDFPGSEIEILVVDDGSTDGTAEIVEQFGPAVRLLKKVNGGQASAFNAGIREAKGEIIAFLDGDDWWAPDKLTKTIGYLDNNPEVGVLGHGLWEFASDSGKHVEVVPIQTRDISFDSPADSLFFRHTMSFFGTSRLVVRKKVLDRISAVPESIVIEADEYLAIVGIAYSRGVLLAEPLTFYRLHADNLYQFRDRNPTKLRRLQRSLESLATELELALRHASVAPASVDILTQTLRNGAKRMRLELDGGTRWEVFEVELARQKFHQPDAPFTYRLFQYFGLALAMVLGPRRFYRLRDWYSASPLREWRSKVANPSPETRFTSSDKSPEPAVPKTEGVV